MVDNDKTSFFLIMNSETKKEFDILVEQEYREQLNKFKNDRRNKMKQYWIAYNRVDGCVEYCEGEMHWYNGNRCWDGRGERGIISSKSGWASHRGGPIQVWLSESDKY